MIYRERIEHRALPYRVCALVGNLGKSPKRRNKAQSRLIAKIMSDNYEQKLSAEIITGNYTRKNVRIIGILAYPKIA